MRNDKDYGLVNWDKYFRYDANSKSGLIWLKTQKEAGTNCHGYWKVKLFGKQWYAHRIVWLLFNDAVGFKMVIDHLDGNSTNNKIENLREVSCSENLRNIKRSDSTKYPVFGIVKIKKKRQNGSVDNYYKVVIRSVCGKISEKLFNIDTLGEPNALALAVSYRLEKEKEIGNYTTLHGKEV